MMMMVYKQTNSPVSITSRQCPTTPTKNCAHNTTPISCAASPCTPFSSSKRCSSFFCTARNMKKRTPWAWTTWLSSSDSTFSGWMESLFVYKPSSSFVVVISSSFVVIFLTLLCLSLSVVFSIFLSIFFLSLVLLIVLYFSFFLLTNYLHKT